MDKRLVCRWEDSASPKAAKQGGRSGVTNGLSGGAADKGFGDGFSSHRGGGFGF